MLEGGWYKEETVGWKGNGVWGWDKDERVGGGGVSCSFLERCSSSTRE